MAAVDRRDVRGRAADLDDDAVDDAGVTQRAGDRRRRDRSRACARRAAEAGEVGRAAVAAHHHHGARDPDLGDAALDDVGGAEGDREDRRVDRRGDRAQLEAVEAAELARGAHREARLGAELGDRDLVGVVVGRERLGDAERR